MKKQDDFVMVRLSAAGVRMAGEGKIVRVNTTRRSFVFRVGELVRIERSYEWRHLLAQDKFEGQPIFEIAETNAAVNETIPSNGEMKES